MRRDGAFGHTSRVCSGATLEPAGTFPPALVKQMRRKRNMGNTFQRWMARMALLAVPFVALLWDPAPGWAGTITLGSAQGFAVLGGQTVTNTHSTTIRGDVGVYPGRPSPTRRISPSPERSTK